MKFALKFVMALMVTILVMLTFRALVFTVYTVNGAALEPLMTDGDRVLVDKWSYGLRTGGGGIFAYSRWAASPVKRGDIAVFDNPADKLRHHGHKDLLAYYCAGIPGDTVKAGDTPLTVPGKGVTVKVTADNMRLLCHLYNTHEGRKAEIKGGRLVVDGKATACASFAYDYYWFCSARPSAGNPAQCFALVPETHIIGKVIMLLYSVDPSRPFYECLRPGRWLLTTKALTDKNGKQ